MGFLENLRRQRDVAAEASRKIYLREKAAEESNNKLRAERERAVLQEAILAKKQFDESGVEDLANTLLGITGGVFSRDPAWRHNLDAPLFYSGNGKYECEVDFPDLVIDRTYIVHRYRVFIGIDATHFGAIIFRGDGRRGSSIVPKNVWKRDKNALENALRKAYEHPQKKFMEGGHEEGWTM